MHFRIKEFRSFVASIEKAGLQQSDFDYVKKRGWLNIVNKEIKTSFRYHRKKVTSLDENQQWLDTYEFWIQIGKEKQLLPEESGVQLEFEKWLQGIKR